MTGHLPTWTRCSTLFVSLAAPAVFACGFDWPSGDGLAHSTFDTHALCRPDEAALVLDYSQAFATGEGLWAPDLSKLNLDEWVAFFGNKLPADAWGTLLYKDPLPRLDALIFALQGKQASTAADQPFLAYADRDTLVSALFYVGFAKRVERLVPQLSADPWEAPAPPKVESAEALARLVTAGKKAYASAKSPFLRERYAFQLLRLHFHHLAAADGLAFFDTVAADFTTSSSIGWRAKGLAAGLLRKAGKVAEANVAYLALYDRYPPLKVTALQSLSWPNDATWNRSLELAKTTREKTLLWQALGFRTDAMRAMKAIRELDPASDLLPLLVGRELNSVEEDLGNDGPAEVGKRLEALRTFLEAGADKGNVAQPAAWDVAAGHLRVVSGDVAGAQRFFDRAAARGKLTPAAQQQLRASRVLAAVMSKQPLAPSDDDAVLRELDWVYAAPPEAGRLMNLRTRARATLSKKLAARGDLFPSVCIAGHLEPLHGDAAQVARFVDFLRQPPKGALEALAIKRCEFKVAQLQELQGLVALYAGDVAQAEKLLGNLVTEPLPADPFVARTIDCHDCDADAKHKPVTRAQFVKRLATLSKEATTPGPKAAQKHFELATGLYNMTWWGNARAVYGDTLFHRAAPTRDVTPALREYQLAAAATKDPELKARATFMQAKCELAQFYESRKNNDARDFVAGPAFKALVADSAKTAFFREALQECGYLRTFAR